MSNGAISVPLVFEDNALAQELFGAYHAHLTRLEKVLEVDIHARGNELSLCGETVGVEHAVRALQSLYGRLHNGMAVRMEDVDAAVRLSAKKPINGAPDDTVKARERTIKTKLRPITARSPNQVRYLELLDACDMVFALGPAGTGKTYLAVARAVELFLSKEVERIILSRPAVEAGERLGFLPGDVREKVDPYLRPLYDALYEMLGSAEVEKYVENGDVEIAPLAFMRGRTLSDAAVIMDEAQNATPMQMKMLLTRLGNRTKMVITGDLSQVDLPKGEQSGLCQAVETLGGIEGIGIITLKECDVMRHPLVARIIEAYDRHE